MDQKISEQFSIALENKKNMLSDSMYRKDLWTYVKNYADLIEANVLFLSGKIDGSPGHDGPVDEETVPMLDKLIQINKLGFVTIESQPGKCDTEFSEYAQNQQKKRGNIDGKGMVSTRQRGYIMGMFPVKHTQDLINAVYAIQAENILFYVDEMARGGFRVKIYIGNTILEPENFDLLGNSVILTEERLDEEEWQPSTKLPFRKTPGISRSTLAEFRSYLDSDTMNFIRDNFNVVEIVRMEKCKTDLDDILLQALKNISGLTEEKTEESTENIWKNVKNHQDLINTNVMFLQGKIDSTPTHMGKVDEETIPMLDTLVKINQLGFITTQSQPGLCETKFSEYALKKQRKRGISDGKGMVSTRQRAYIEGIYPTKHIDILSENIHKFSGDILVYSISLANPSESVVYRKNFMTTNPVGKIVLTEDRVDDDEWKNYSNLNFSPEMAEDLLLNFSEYFSKKMMNLLKKQFSFVFIVRMEKCKTDLDDILLRALENIS